MFNKKSILMIIAVCLVFALFAIPQTNVTAAPIMYLTTEVTGSGSVNPAYGEYGRNNIVPIEAIADAGWTFDHWAGALSGNANPTTIRMDSSKHVIAVFVQDVPATATPAPTATTDPTGPTPTPTATFTPAPPSNNTEVVGYFAQWAIYQRDYYVKNVVTSGSADTLTTINYAFAGIDANLNCYSLDTFADYNKRFDAIESVDGVGDTVAQPLKGNFNQILKLKQMYPNIKVVISLGGWTQSFRFSDAALPQNRAAFVASCIDMFINGNMEPGINAAGVFDGIDIDWEYPAACGNTCDYRPEDTQNFTALLAEFRSQLDAIDPNLLLTIATSAGADKYNLMELNQIHQYLDWINIMAYDFHGGFEASGPTNHQAALYSNPNDPNPMGSGNDAVLGYIAGGVPANKLTLGVPFYGRGWGNVPDVDNGLYQPAGRIPRGKYEQGIDDYKELAALGYPSYWDPIAQAHWIFNGSTFWTYDDANSILNKMNYINNMGLKGVMFWELSGDDSSGTLINAIATGVQ